VKSIVKPRFLRSSTASDTVSLCILILVYSLKISVNY
jgi:hypothetical protein